MNKNKKILLFSLGSVVLICAAILVLIIGHAQTKSEIRIEANTESNVYLNDKHIGVTPISYEVPSTKVILKVIPLGQNLGYLPYETTLSLTPRTKTIVRHNFNSTISNSTTQIMSLKKETKNSAPMTIITNPESSYVFVNNEYIGTSPLRIDKPSGTYSVQVMHTGFQAMQVTLKSTTGYNLTTFLDLAATSLTTDGERASALHRSQTVTSGSAFVTILKSPTGYVRVHEMPEESSQEISRALVGREYPFEAYSPLKDWLKINLNASESGWILARYATVSGEIVQ